MRYPQLLKFQKPASLSGSAYSHHRQGKGPFVLEGKRQQQEFLLIGFSVVVLLPGGQCLIRRIFRRLV